MEKTLLEYTKELNKIINKLSQRIENLNKKLESKDNVIQDLVDEKIRLVDEKIRANSLASEDIFSKLEETIINYPKEEKEYMMEMDKHTKVDLLLQLNHFNNLHKMEMEKLNK